MLDPATRTAPAVFEAANPAGALRIGMTARITAVTGVVRGPVIPASAIVDDNGKPVAFVQTGGESFERRAQVEALIDAYKPGAAGGTPVPRVTPAVPLVDPCSARGRP